MRRLTRGRDSAGDQATAQERGASDPVEGAADAQPGAAGVPANGVPASEQPTAVETAVADETAVAEPSPARDLPAGVDPAELASAPTSAGRGRLRRRLRYLRAAREILLRDLGGFYLEAHRSDEGADAHRRLLDAKAARLERIETELRDLETRLGEPHAQTVLREPGLGGTCPQCGELHGSSARFCWRCGSPVTGRPAPARAPASAAPTGNDAKATTASLWGRPKRPDAASGEAAGGEASGAAASGDEGAASGEEASGGPAPAAGPGGVSAETSEPAPEEPAPTGTDRA